MLLRIHDILCVGCYKHLRITMGGPNSSYSTLVIAIFSKVGRDANMEPPIQAEWSLWGRAVTLIIHVGEAAAVTSFVKRSTIPRNSVLPPKRTIFY